MERIPVENKSAMPIYVAGQMIPPGEIRHFDKEQVPRHFWTVAPEPEVVKTEEPNPLADLLKSNVPTVAAALDGMPTESIELLGEMEQLGQARKGVLSAVSEILLARAAAESLHAAGEGAAAKPEGSAE